MKLSNRTFLYSLLLAVLVAAVVFAYMLFLTPSLYSEDIMKNNLSDLKETHEGFLKNDNFDQAQGTFRDNILGLIIEDNAYDIDIKSIGMSGKLAVKDEDIKKIIDEIRSSFNQDKKDEKANFDDNINDYFDLLFKKVEDNSKPLIKQIQKMVNLELNVKKDFFHYEIGKTNMYTMGKNTLILESSVVSKSTNTKFLSYMAISNIDGRLYISSANTFMPDPNQIKPTIINSLYVILPLIFLLSLFISALLSKKIVKPIELLSKDVDMRKGSEYSEPIEVKGDEEIQNLAESLNLLYENQKKSMDKLKLEAEKKEVFMRAFSHQLKTPLASSSLLVDSMIANVGKFSDRDKYLPEVKNELNSMKKILSRILDVNNMVKEIKISAVNLRGLVDISLGNNKIEAQKKAINLSVSGQAIWNTDGEILYQIINNLVGNAIQYTPDAGFIEVEISRSELVIINYPASIDDNMKNTIFEAFVTGNNQKGSGLGLYVSKHFADSLNLELYFKNEDERVVFIIKRKEIL